MSNLSSEQVARACHAIRQADGLIIGAGAGMGVDSGLPDFRGQQGLWKAYPALADAGMEFGEIANPMAFEFSPKLAWGFYGHRFNLYRLTVPHEGFDILRNIGEKLANKYQVFSSNVDGHFHKAGFEERRIVECHGSINFLQCCNGCNNDIWSAARMKITTDDESCLATSPLPRCPHCGEIARPNIMMFDDFQWLRDYVEAQMIRMRKNINAMKSPVVIECGAGTSIPTVRQFCESISAPLIRINPLEAECPRAGDISVACGAKEGLQMIDRALKALGFYEI